jgi:hypothetical protein
MYTAKSFFVIKMPRSERFRTSRNDKNGAMVDDFHDHLDRKEVSATSEAHELTSIFISKRKTAQRKDR